MQSISIVKESCVVQTPRTMQVRGMFDLPESDRLSESWNVKIDLDREWNIGLIVGSSGSGKTTIINEMFGDFVVDEWEWDRERAIVDCFQKDAGIKDITGALSAVGLSSPPSWLKPYHVLSNGEKFRANLSRSLVESKNMFVIDEFTSVVDRTVAKVCSSAISKAVKRSNKKMIAASCHYDIIEWLEPDWIYDMSFGEFRYTRGLLRRPKIKLDIQRVNHSAWELFRKHHYLNTSLNNSSRCFCGFYDGVPVAFSAVLHFPHAKVRNMKREHRTVCLPDYQGVGIGNAMSDFIGSMVTGLGFRYSSQTSHPSMIHFRNKSFNWKMTQSPTVKKPRGGSSSTKKSWSQKARKRNVASFEYLGPKMDTEKAFKLWNASSSAEA